MAKTRDITFKQIHPSEAASAPFDNSEEPNRFRCKQCGMPCDENRDVKCPWCESENFKP